MKRLNRSHFDGQLPSWPERIVQFGEGNFLRAFADWMVDILNERGLFGGRIAIVQPLPCGQVPALNQQDGLYTVLLRGLENGRPVESRRLIRAVSRGLNPYEQWEETVACFCQPTIRFVISNTTEAGIVPCDEPLRPCPQSFPAKVAALLYERFRRGLPGLVFLPCELIDRNGDNLQRIVLQHAVAWNLGDQFLAWLREKNHFLNTLVDRIVPGHPATEMARLRDELGYDDPLLVAGESFHLWVIEGPPSLAEEIPFHRAGLNVVWTDNLEPYRTRKVRILNGTHTATVLAAHLAGLKTVGEMMSDPNFSRLIRELVFDEIVPTVPLPADEKRAYAESVLERFQNPFIHHELLTIALNSVSKWKTRCLPTLLDFHRATGRFPKHLTYSLAALIEFYRQGKHARDEAHVLQFFREHRDSPTLVADTLANTSFWGRDLTKIPGLLQAVQIPVLLRLNHRDNVAVITCTGHKVATTDIASGRDIIKYGQPIGVATADIAAGQAVHTHNLRTKLAGIETYSYTPIPAGLTPVTDPRTFDGYRRDNGEVGIRNELWIIPTVGCVNETAEAMARAFGSEVFVWKHPYGCSQLGDDLAMTHRLLVSLARHPNAGGVLLLGLGCENNTLDSFRAELQGARYQFLSAQQTGDEIAEGVRALRALAEVAATARREPVPLSELRVGLKCGGSDAFSGITANPLVGVFSDRLVARGGTTVLTEVPEMFGAETCFLNRCVNRDVFDRAVAMLNGFKKYYLDHGQPVYENPSPGNKEGGITTLEEKSLGCIQKGGTAPIVDVLDHGDRLRSRGLNLLSGPGNDIVACTALAAAGVHLILFTTGRGTPLGGPVPTLKISTRSALAERKPHWIDFDAGRLLGGATMDALADELLAQVIEIASGRRKTRAEENGFREIALFKNGVTL